MRIKTRFVLFCNSLIVKDSQKSTGVSFKNSVLKQAKMVTIFQRKIRNTAIKLQILFR